MADANHSIDSTPSPPFSRADTPEAVLAALPAEYWGPPASLLNCVLLRAHAVLMLVSNELEDEERTLSHSILACALWDVLGNLEIAQTLVNRWSIPSAA